MWVMATEKLHSSERACATVSLPIMPLWEYVGHMMHQDASAHLLPGTISSGDFLAFIQFFLDKLKIYNRKV